MLCQISEERTRKEMIDPQLEQAGWYLCAVKSVFLQKCHLETNAFMGRRWIFGTDAVERWFSEIEIMEVLKFAKLLTVTAITSKQ